MTKRYSNGEETEHIVTDQLANMFHCPDCGFEYHAQHIMDDKEGGYVCALCELQEKENEIKRLNRTIGKYAGQIQEVIGKQQDLSREGLEIIREMFRTNYDD